MKVKSESEVKSSVVSDSSRPHGLQAPGSSVHGIFQARVLEWGAIAFFGLSTQQHSKTTEMVHQKGKTNKIKLVPQHVSSEKAMAPHSSTLAWKIPWTEEPGGLQSMGSLRVGYD